MMTEQSKELSKEISVEEQQERDRSCDLAKREHKYFWIWNDDGHFTNWVRCGKCVQTKFLGK